MHQAGLGGMRVRVNETRDDSFSAEVDFLGSGTSKIQNVGIATQGKKSSSRNSHGLGARLPVIHRQNVSVIKDKFRLFLFQREERKRGECAEKFAARSSIVHDGPLYDMERMLRMLRRRWANVNVPTRKAEGELASQAAEEFVEFVGGIEVAFEFARAEFFAKVVEPAREEVEGRGENFLIGEDDIAPSAIGTAGEAQRIAQAGTSQRNGQAVFVEAVVEESSESDGHELWQMRGKADGVIMLRRTEPERPRANFLQDFRESGHARIFLRRRRANECVSVAAEEVGVSVGDAGEFAAGHGMAAQKEWASII